MAVSSRAETGPTVCYYIYLSHSLLFSLARILHDLGEKNGSAALPTRERIIASPPPPYIHGLQLKLSFARARTLAYFQGREEFSFVAVPTNRLAERFAEHPGEMVRGRSIRHRRLEMIKRVV